MNATTATSSAPLTRREFLMGTAALLATVPLVRAMDEDRERPADPQSAVIVFQGDSITDAGRSREAGMAGDPAALGAGYVGLVAQRMLADPTNRHIQIYNRGISGNRVIDLLVRWERDTLALEPDLVSILIGVNDTWHRYLPGGVGIKVPRYAAIYRMLIEDTLERRPHCRLVLGEPFALPGGQIKPEWMDEMRERMAVVRNLAREFRAVYVPFQEIFELELKRHSAAELAADGVHPTLLGHQIMADAWCAAAGFRVP